MVTYLKKDKDNNYYVAESALEIIGFIVILPYLLILIILACVSIDNSIKTTGFNIFIKNNPKLKKALVDLISKVQSCLKSKLKPKILKIEYTEEDKYLNRDKLKKDNHDAKYFGQIARIDIYDSIQTIILAYGIGRQDISVTDDFMYLDVDENDPRYKSLVSKWNKLCKAINDDLHYIKNTIDKSMDEFHKLPNAKYMDMSLESLTDGISPYNVPSIPDTYYINLSINIPNYKNIEKNKDTEKAEKIVKSMIQ